MAPRTKYWWRVDLYEPDELTTAKTHGLPFRRIEFRGPMAHAATGKHRQMIQERLAKIDYRLMGTLERGSLKPRGEWEWRAGLWLAQQRPGKEISGRVSQMERPFLIGPGPDQPVPKARGVNVIDWPRGRPNPGKRLVWSIDQIMEVESRLEAGERADDVAAAMGVSGSSVRKLADDVGMSWRRAPKRPRKPKPKPKAPPPPEPDPPSRARRHTRLTEEQRQEVMEQSQRGMTDGHIAKKFGVSVSQVRKVLAGRGRPRLSPLQRQIMGIVADFELGLTSPAWRAEPYLLAQVIAERRGVPLDLVERALGGKHALARRKRKSNPTKKATKRERRKLLNKLLRQ